jgi:hypothetical protein
MLSPQGGLENRAKALQWKAFALFYYASSGKGLFRLIKAFLFVK